MPKPNPDHVAWPHFIVLQGGYTTAQKVQGLGQRTGTGLGESRDGAVMVGDPVWRSACVSGGSCCNSSASRKIATWQGRVLIAWKTSIKE